MKIDGEHEKKKVGPGRCPLVGTDLWVSPICLGTMTFGAPVGAKGAVDLVDWALDHGINFFDTADIYEGYNRTLGSAGGAGEQLLGKALVGKRDQAIITTKLGNPIKIGTQVYSGLGREHIYRQIDASLSRLRMTHVDLYLMHCPDPETPLAESIQAMSELIRLGKVRYWGFSNFDTTMIHEIMTLCAENDWPRPVVSQPLYSWINRQIEQDHLPTCLEYNINVTPYRVLEGGLLTGKYRNSPPASDSRATQHPNWLSKDKNGQVDQFLAEAKIAKLLPSAYAVQWPLRHPAVKSVIVGSKHPAQLEPLLPCTAHPPHVPV
jgi:L-glyceraldehyde 3-phosphate reductase